jgi:hypothetical protein
MRTQAHHRGKGKAAVNARLSTAKDARKGLAASTCTNAAEAMLRHQEECTMGHSSVHQQRWVHLLAMDIECMM